MKELYSKSSEQPKRSSKKFMRSIVAFIMTVAVFIGMAPEVAFAGPGYPFGGMTYYVRYCRCTHNYAIYFNDLTVSSGTAGLPLIYQPGGTTVYPFGRITSTGVWILGTFSPGGVCLRRSGHHCRLVLTAGTMNMVGTSQ